MDTETKPRMTVADIALMREIVRWRKNHDIDFVRRIVPYGAPYWKDYRTGREVWFQPKDWPSLFVVAGRHVHGSAVFADSVAQAVDALVAYGYLPQRFSSAYRAGWHAAQVWYDDQMRDEDELKRLFGDPENISFPAGDES